MGLDSDVGKRARDDLCWSSFLSRRWAWRMVIFQLELASTVGPVMLHPTTVCLFCSEDATSEPQIEIQWPTAPLSCCVRDITCNQADDERPMNRSDFRAVEALSLTSACGPPVSSKQNPSLVGICSCRQRSLHSGVHLGPLLWINPPSWAM